MKIKICFLVLIISLPQLLMAQWSLSRFDEYNFFNKLDAVTPTTTFVTGMAPGIMESFILRTSDGGATWDSIAVALAGTNYSFSELRFTDVDNGVAGGLKNNYQALMKTSNNGNAWTEISPNPTSLDPISAISFIDPLNGWVADQGTVYKTNDGGSSWITTTPGFMVSDFTFVDADNGVACGASGTMGVVMQTTDGGQSWNNLLTAAAPFFANSSIEKVQVVTNNIMFASMQYANMYYRTTDGGMTWDTTTLSQIYTIQDFDFLNANEGRVLSSMGEIFATADGGLTWTLEYAVATGAYGPNVFLNGISFAGTTGFVCGSNGLIKKYEVGATGISEAGSLHNIAVYPNPVQSNASLFVDGVNGNYQYLVYNNIGQLVRQGEQDANEISLQLPAGFYVINIVTPTEKFQKQLVVLTP